MSRRWRKEYGWTWADQCFYGYPETVTVKYYETAASIRRAEYTSDMHRHITYENRPEIRAFWEINGIPALPEVARRARIYARGFEIERQINEFFGVWW